MLLTIQRDFHVLWCYSSQVAFFFKCSWAGWPDVQPCYSPSSVHRSSSIVTANCWREAALMWTEQGIFPICSIPWQWTEGSTPWCNDPRAQQQLKYRLRGWGTRGARGLKHICEAGVCALETNTAWPIVGLAQGFEERVLGLSQGSMLSRILIFGNGACEKQC